MLFHGDNLGVFSAVGIKGWWMEEEDGGYCVSFKSLAVYNISFSTKKPLGICLYILITYHKYCLICFGKHNFYKYILT